ncbi:MAG: hypothetical protein LBO78_02665 [Rickettsiales bacterium]|jgi:hypothetical protein|nr:hypothetical protein [Rickettsiales bacterium]
MYKQTITNTHFAYGEISPGLYGRGDIPAYKGGAMMIRNMRVVPTGGVMRRGGLEFKDMLDGVGKLVVFEYSARDVFLLFFGDGYVRVYGCDGGRMCEFASPYPYGALKNIRWSQKGSELFIVHPDIHPKTLRYNPKDGSWSVSNWVFGKSEETGVSSEPFTRFFDTEGVVLAPSGVADEIALASDRPFFDGRYVGVALALNGGSVEIVGVDSPASARAVVSAELSGTEPDKYWMEQAFSSLRGYPSSIAFHQNRLVLGGSPSLPNRLWFSHTGDYMNFDLGDGLDSEGIEFDMLSDKINEILCVFSGRHLQVFTSDSEWMVAGSPLTPASVSVRQQTKIGSVSDRFISPKLVEGSTIFVARNNREIREFFYGDIEDSYHSEDLISFSSHLLNHPVEQDYDVKNRMLYVVEGDGTLSVLLVNKAREINSWFRYETEGKFVSLAVLGDRVYAVVERGGAFFLECFSDDVFADCAKKFEFPEASARLGGLGHLEGRTVAVNADGHVSEAKVENGEVVLPEPAKSAFVGIPYSHLLCPLPVLIGGYVPPKAVRLVEVAFRIMDTPLIQVDTGGGLRSFTSVKLDGGAVFGRALPEACRDVRVKSRGFLRNFDMPLWKLSGAKPLGVRILNISASVECVR